MSAKDRVNAYTSKVPAKNYAQEVDRARLKDAVDVHSYKNPNQFTDPRQRLAAHLAKIQSIMNSDKFKSLSPERQYKVKESYYNEVIVPGYAQMNFKAPDQQGWIKNIGDPKLQLKSEDYFKGGSALQNMVVHAVHGSGQTLVGMSHGGVWLGQQASLAVLGLNLPFPNSMQHELIDHVNNLTHRVDKAINQVSDDIMETTNFWSDTHPSKKLSDKFGAFTGEMVGTIPLYEVMGKGTGKILDVTGVGNLTKILNVGQKFMAKRLGDAVDAYTIGTIEGQTPQEKLSSMYQFMGMGTAFGVAGKIAVSSSKQIKTLTANVLSIGGRPFQQAITNEAEHELMNELIGGVKVESPEHAQELIVKAHQADPVKHAVVSAEKGVLSSIARKMFDGKRLNQLSKAQRAQVLLARANLTEDTLQELPLHIPDVAKENIKTQIIADMDASPTVKKAFADLHAMFPDLDPIELVHEEEQKVVAKETGVKTSQGAIKKVGKKLKINDGTEVNLPTELKGAKPNYGYQNKLFKLDFKDPRDLAVYTLGQLKDNKAQAKFTEYIHQQFPKAKFQDFLAFREVIKDHIKSLAKDGDPKKGPLVIQSIAHDLKAQGRQGSAEKVAGEIKQESQDRFASFKVNSLAYFKNPAPKGSGKRFDFKGWLQDMDSKTFVQELQDNMMSRGQKFERPYHAMLWGLKYKNQMPKAFSTRLIEELHELKPSETIAEWDKKGKILEAHMLALSETGHLDAEGNIFKSTNVENWTKPSEWMRDLRTEFEADEMQQLEGAFKDYPQAYKGAVKVLANLQKMRFKSPTPDRYIELSEQIRTAIKYQGDK